MKEFRYELLPSNGMALLTAPEIDGESRMFLADFRDQQVLIFKPTGHFLGFSSSLGLRLCKGPPKMVDGMWIVNDDYPANTVHEHVQLKSDLLDFVSI